MTTRDILRAKETADVVVIGGGVIGLTIARALALRRVKDVILIERAKPGAEASYAAGGILAPQAEADCSDEFFELAGKSRDMYPSFAEALRQETGTEVELETTGTLYVGFSENDTKEIEERYRWQTSAGLAVEKLNAEDSRRLEPCVSQNVRCALRFPLDIQVENRRLLVALLASNQQFGVQLMTDTKVESIEVIRGRVRGVETSRGFISTPRAVIAAGSWTSFISTSEDSDKRLPRLRIEPVRGQMICFAAHPSIARHVIYSPRGYIIPRADGRLLAGSTTEHVGFDKRVTTSGIQRIMAHACQIAPRLGDLPMIDSWAGLRPRAEDDLPVLGPCAEIEGLWYATGHYRNGILLAPITGELIAEAIVSNVVSPLLSAFAPERFELVGANN